MQSNQTLHISIKEPHKSQEPIRLIGIFPHMQDEAQFLAILKQLIFSEVSVPPDPSFEQDLREELLKLLLHQTKVLAMSRDISTGLTTVILKETHRVPT